jgi:hypothetical protein
VRKRELRVDFLTPARDRESREAVPVAALGIHAAPLPLLGFVLEDTQPAVALARAGILVRVPHPARFALHKLFVASERPPACAARARKDRMQAAALLEILGEDRPGDLAGALSELGSRSRAARRVRAELARLPESARRHVQS